MALSLFVRQPFTHAGAREQGVVQGVLDVLTSLDGKPVRIELVTGKTAERGDTFRDAFGKTTGSSFSPKAFRARRLDLLRKSDAMIVIYAGVSESSAFEVSFNIFGGPKVPLLYVLWRQRPIKTTLLQELDDLCDVTYTFFDDPEDLRGVMLDFLTRIERSKFTSSAFGAVKPGAAE